MDTLLEIDPTSGTALHRQVYDGLRSAILGGRLRPGERLPATRSLAEQLSLARMTVAEAYDQLRAEGYIEARRGAGTYVSSDLPGSALASPSSTPDLSRRVYPLSVWGQHLARGAERSRRGEARGYKHDLRPHRVAADGFPWAEWNEAAERALRASRTDLLSYPPAAGHPALQEAIAAHVRSYRAVSCTPGHVVIVNGAQQGLNLLAQLLLERGERVAVEDPGYPTARQSLEARGLLVTRVPVDREGLSVDALLQAGPQRLIHVTPSHQDPTGATMSLGRRLALLDVAERTGALIVEDDYDSEFRFEGRPVESLQGLDRSGLVAYAGTFSKSLLAGLRLGFLILPPDLVEPFVAARSLWDGGTPLLEQAILAEFMRSGAYERHIRRMRRLYRGRRDALVEALEENFRDRVSIGERHGGLNILVSFDLPIADTDLALEAERAGLGLRPASPYYSQPPDHPSFLLGFAALSEEELRGAVAELATVMRSLTDAA